MQMVETATMPAVEWAVYGETPVCWVEVDAPYAAGIMFRAGSADETLPTRGLTHLVEHLALQRFGDNGYHFNGAVGPTTTTFHATGRPEEVAAFLERAVASVGRLDVSRLGSELKVMRIEDESHSEDVVGAALRSTFGYRDYGLIGTSDLGLAMLEPELIRMRAADAFTRRNAVVWVVGTPPPQLDLQIPEGRWHAPPAIGADRPAVARRVRSFGSGGVAVGLLMERTPAARIAMGVAATRAHRLLREERGLSYGVQTDWTVLDGIWAQATIAADCVDEDAQQVAELLIGVLERIGATGATWDELSRIDEEEVESLRQPAAHVGLLQASAADYLLGRTPRTAAERILDRRAVDEPDVAAAMRTGLERAMVLIPWGTRWRDHRWSWWDLGAQHPIKGRTFKERGQARLGGLLSREGAYAMVIGPAGMSAGVGSDVTIYAVEDMAGYLKHRDGSRVVFSRGGGYLPIDPRGWIDGETAVGLLDRVVPPELHILALG